MSIFEIIFANFWTWAGTVVLVATLLDGLANVIAAMRKPERSVRRTSYSDGTSIVQIDNATAADVHDAGEIAYLRERDLLGCRGCVARGCGFAGFSCHFNTSMFFDLC